VKLEWAEPNQTNFTQWYPDNYTAYDFLLPNGSSCCSSGRGAGGLWQSNGVNTTLITPENINLEGKNITTVNEIGGDIAAICSEMMDFI